MRCTRRGGHPSVPPERLLKSTLLMALYSVRSGRLFCEQLDYNLLFRWFLDMDLVEESFNHSTFSKNRERLLEHDIARKFLGEIVRRARSARLMSDDHSRWTTPSSNFHGEKRSNETHESTTDPESRLFRKNRNHKAKLSYHRNVLMENRKGLIVDLRIDQSSGYAERIGALALLDEHVPNSSATTLRADAGYDTSDFVAACRGRGITPHIAQTRDKRRRSAVDGRTTRHGGYLVSQRIRKRVEEIFGWTKTVACFRKTRFRGRARTQLAAHFVAAAYNLLRMARLLPA